MAETIEAFVAKLQQDGVRAGQQTAEKLSSEAKTQAEQIIADAQREAQKIISDANAEAANALARSKTDLELAARDASMRLRASLNSALTGLLGSAVEGPLGDPEFLKKVIHELMSQYAKADIEGVSTAKICLSPDMHKQLVDWAIQELHQAAMGQAVSIDLKDTLRQAGFEYSIKGGTVEVTEESIVAILASMVGPSLRELFDASAAKE